MVRKTAAEALDEPEAWRIVKRADAIDRLRTGNATMWGPAADDLVDSGLADTATMKRIALLVRQGEPMIQEGLIAGLERAWYDRRTLAEVLADHGRRRESDAAGIVARAAQAALEAENSPPDLSPYRQAMMGLVTKSLEADDANAALRAFRTARRYLGSLKEYRPLLERLVLSSNADLRYEASEALLRFDGDAVPGLTALLARPDENCRGLALAQLARLGILAVSARPAIEKAREDPNPAIREMAQIAINRIMMPPSAPPAVARSFHPSEEVEARRDIRDLPPSRREEFINLLRSESQRVRLRAAIDLRAWRVLEPAVEAALVKAVNAGDFAARVGLILGLEGAWKEGAGVRSYLMDRAVNEKDATSRVFIRAAIRAIEGEEIRRKWDRECQQ